MFPLISVSSHQYADHTICIGNIHLLAMQHLGNIWRQGHTQGEGYDEKDCIRQEDTRCILLPHAEAFFNEQDHSHVSERNLILVS